MCQVLSCEVLVSYFHVFLLLESVADQIDLEENVLWQILLKNPPPQKPPNIFFDEVVTNDGEALYSQQKQDWELTVAQIMNSLLPYSDLNWRK